MAGMEIFETDDFSSDEFYEIDDSLLMPSEGDDTPPPEQKPADKKPKEKEKVDDDNDDIDVDNNDSEDLELLLPSGKSANADDDTEPNSSTLSPQFFSSLVQALKEGGILEDVTEQDIKSQEDFFTVLEESIKQREFSDLNDSQKEYLEALRAGIPHEEIVDHQQTMASYEEITDESISAEGDDAEELRRNIIMTNFTAKGISEVKAKKLTDKIFDSGDDIEEASDALKELKAAEKQQFENNKRAVEAQKKAREKSERDAVANLNKIVKETKEIIPGLQIPQNIKTEIIKGLTQPVDYTEDKRPLDIISKYLYDNPIDGRFKLAYILKVTDGFKKMTVLEDKKAKKSAFNELAKIINEKDRGGAVSFNENEGKTFNLNDYEFI